MGVMKSLASRHRARFFSREALDDALRKWGPAPDYERILAATDLDRFHAFALAQAVKLWAEVDRGVWRCHPRHSPRHLEPVACINESAIRLAAYVKNRRA